LALDPRGFGLAWALELTLRRTLAKPGLRRRTAGGNPAAATAPAASLRRWHPPHPVG
jgi:hypothetical protein